MVVQREIGVSPDFVALTERDRLIVQMDQALLTWDVWLCPVAATTAFTHRATIAQ